MNNTLDKLTVVIATRVVEGTTTTTDASVASPVVEAHHPGDDLGTTREVLSAGIISCLALSLTSVAKTTASGQTVQKTNRAVSECGDTVRIQHRTFPLATKHHHHSSTSCDTSGIIRHLINFKTPVHL